MTADDTTVHDTWMAVARAGEPGAAESTFTGDEVFYGDLTLRDSAVARAWGELIRAIRSAVDVAAGEGEIIDALCSGDPRLDVSEAADPQRQPRTTPPTPTHCPPSMLPMRPPLGTRSAVARSRTASSA